ncbi:MAG: DUF1289 domain-containing protein [Sphingomonadales bacterium]|nr:DUF1289 domain-containing protein [Sphingomonadales bacterium]PIX67269.1 MAG: DUF1289 domain-containing protein [Sphingomonadales bacterium CG_4_10_14_3_um_filter_58_15]NCO50197.1 DUF1289 domain-containing protein [Sphingomonadales bacterium]NCP00240.1 DUF1289 domain-containing protein [Sphingomonadales bacterium]NCP27752.1 DUF1289 domain-containing protein [Sphingomonadales bacterium]
MKSPCNDICKIDRPSGLCIGCGRTLSEIGEWGSASDERRRAIFALLPARIAALGTRFQG